MCCFSQPVVSVTDTNLFARLSENGTQFLAYQMQFETEKPNAMILPLPVIPNRNDDAVRFISLEKYDDLFKDLDKGFPEMSPPPGNSRSWGVTSAPTVDAHLEVHQVGDFVASFVPTMNDFSRLDPQFVIPKDSWDKIPEYADYGFAVFQLKELGGKPHPMAFEFETRWPDRIFFPTVHIHDGQVHDIEEFDHMLYLQYPGFDEIVGEYKNRDVKDRATGLVRSRFPANKICQTQLTEGIVEPELLVHRFELRGNLKNQDIVQPVSATMAGLPIQPPSALRYWPILPAVMGLAGMGWLFNRRSRLMQEKSRSV